MFTGIIEEVGTVEHIQRGAHSAILHIRTQHVLDDLHLGDSIAVNGVCLTVVSFHAQGFAADVMHETLNRSTLSALHGGSRVNLERAMPANGRFGGHIVAGHVDGTGTVRGVERDGNAIWYIIQAEAGVLRYVVEKGSIAVDGISLTVAAVGKEDFSVSVIPHTAQMTVLKERKPGDKVNLETDVIGKYVEKLLAPTPDQPSERGLTLEFLTQYGY